MNKLSRKMQASSLLFRVGDSLNNPCFVFVKHPNEGLSFFLLNPLKPGVAYRYALKTPGNLKVFCCF